MLNIIRVKNNEQLKDCLKIREKVFINEKGVPKEIENDKYDILTNECEHFLIMFDNTLVGTLRCFIKNEDEVIIQRFCIIKKYRKLGLGRKTLSFIENYYKNSKKTIKMDAKYEASKFYEKCGYKKISDIFIEANIEHVKMIKQL